MSTPTNNMLEIMLKQYEDNNKPKAKAASTEYNPNNYFNAILPDNETSGTKIIRVLPTSDGTTPFVEIYGHQAVVEGKKKTFICLQNTKGTACPFCEAREELLSTGKDSDKEIAKKYSARKMYVIKLIDRDDEKHGPKFWRFNHDYRKTGIFDKIAAVLKIFKTDITHPLTGIDLAISIGRDQNNYAVVQSIQALPASPLHTDEAKAAEWLADTKTWENVYGVKPYEFLEIIVKGGTPHFDKVNKKWVDKASVSTDSTEKLDAELSMGLNTVKASVTPANPATPAATNTQQMVDDTDDLPF